MKIRNSFVANSSSSSFIVFYRDIPKTEEKVYNILYDFGTYGENKNLKIEPFPDDDDKEWKTIIEEACKLILKSTTEKFDKDLLAKEIRTYVWNNAYYYMFDLQKKMDCKEPFVFSFSDEYNPFVLDKKLVTIIKNLGEKDWFTDYNLSDAINERAEEIAEQLVEIYGENIRIYEFGNSTFCSVEDCMASEELEYCSALQQTDCIIINKH